MFNLCWICWSCALSRKHIPDGINHTEYLFAKKKKKNYHVNDDDILTLRTRPGNEPVPFISNISALASLCCIFLARIVIPFGVADHFSNLFALRIPVLLENQNETHTQNSGKTIYFTHSSLVCKNQINWQ